MFRAKTVFVLGAGASAEVGLPVGDKLLENICNLLEFHFDFGALKKGDHLFLEALKVSLETKMDSQKSAEELNSYLRAGRQISASSVQAISIDNIVDALEDDAIEMMAKIGIVRAIHLAEKSSKFFEAKKDNNTGIDLRKFGETWYSHLTKIICENRKSTEIEQVFENLSFVSFNYDRCLEHYLPKSIANYYGVAEATVQETVQSLRVHRPYGIAGKLPWQTLPAAASNFGGGDAAELSHAASEIRTFTQGMGDAQKQKAMHSDLMDADRIVFLGSAFHRQNLELLKIPGNQDVEVLATSSGVSDSDQRIVKNELAYIFGIPSKRVDAQIHLAPLFCEPFFREYWRTFTAGVASKPGTRVIPL